MINAPVTAEALQANNSTPDYGHNSRTKKGHQFFETRLKSWHTNTQNESR